MSDRNTDMSGVQMAQVGYVRVSTAVQDGALQRDALVKAGCGRLFEDKASGAKSDRPGLNEAVALSRPASRSAGGAGTER